MQKRSAYAFLTDRLRLLLLFTAVALAWSPANEARALPPLGLTQVESASQSFTFGVGLSIIDGEAYISTSSGVWTVDGTGSTDFTTLVHSELGVTTGGLSRVSQVVQSLDGNLYAAGVFPDPTFGSSAALFDINAPNSQVVTWRSVEYIVGVDHNRRAIGGIGDVFAAEYLPNGMFNELGVPDGCLPGDCESSQRVTATSESGSAIGSVRIPNSLGTGVGLWNPDGSASILSLFGSPSGLIADRLDVQGLNAAVLVDGFEYHFNLGLNEVLLQRDSNGELLPENGRILVSQSDFTVLGTANSQGYYGYYPSIVPNDPNAAVSLEELFPELKSINYSQVTDVYAVENRIYMTLGGPDGLYLFGAIAPSQVPEPSCLTLGLLSCFALSYGSCIRCQS